MSDSFGITEFQFYDWFMDYSTPVSDTMWTDPYRHARPICLSTIQTYIDEIHRQGGRAWAYVQSVASESDALGDPKKGIYPLIDANGKRHWHTGRFPAYFLNTAWARHMAAIWAPAIAHLGFDGIHWDSLGPVAGDYGAECAGTREFLVETKKILDGFGLDQTFNFVELAWWDSGLLASRVIEFPYIETWSENAAARAYAISSASRRENARGVIAFYPAADAASGRTVSQVMIARWREARNRGWSYLLVGDGARRLTGPYFPGTVPITSRERKSLTIEPDTE